MATILELVRLKKLFKYDAVLGPRQQEFRRFYASERLVRWFQVELPNIGSAWKIDTPPAEQLDAFLAQYVTGEKITFGWDLFPIRPHAHRVWELKTPDLRVFGWFNEMDCFIGVVADAARNVKEHQLYSGYCGEVVRFRDKLDLDEPKFLLGELPNDVISNFDYP
jgi:hypothetical protein